MGLLDVLPWRRDKKAVSAADDDLAMFARTE